MAETAVFYVAIFAVFYFTANIGSDRPEDIKHSNADITKARELLGYEPEWSFERGIEAAIVSGEFVVRSIY